MTIAPWLLVSILAYAAGTMLVSNWLVRGFKRPELPSKVTLRLLVDTAANLIWVALLLVFSVLSIRYAERMTSRSVGYLAFAVFGFLLSWIRANLYHRVQDQRQPEQQIDWRALVSALVHWSSYLLCALVLYVGLAWLLNQPVDPLHLVPLWTGALLPDLDSRDSLPGRLLPWLSRRLEDRLGSLEVWHTPTASALVALLASPLILLVGVRAWYLIPLGFFSHLLLDLLAPCGVMLLWPFNHTRYGLFKGVIQSSGCRAERIVVLVLAVVTVALLLAVGSGQPQPSVAPTPTYQQTLERYYSWRGRIQVFAYIEGSWQTSGRPVSGRFEILNAAGESFVILDRFSGEIFSAGQSGEDNVYLDRIILQSGPAVTVKPVELRLERQPLSDILNTVYEMQDEAGLQHIYASGDLFLPTTQDGTSPTLEVDYSQINLRQIQSHDAGHYSLHYLTAAELIQLADLQVETADLIVVATYVSPATGPKATPLPSLTSTAEPLE